MRQTYLFDNYFQNIPAYMYMYIHVLGFHMYLHVGMVMMYTCLLNLQKNKNLREITSIFNKNDDGVHFVLDQQA